MRVQNSTRAVHILLIEDNPGDAELTTLTLQESSVPNHVTVTADGDAALAFLHQEEPYQDATRPDLILLDLNLPGKNGRETLGAIKQDPHLRDIPIVILTVSETERDLLAAYDLAPNCYVVKPLEFDAFLTMLNSLDILTTRSASTSSLGSSTSPFVPQRTSALDADSECPPGCKGETTNVIRLSPDVQERPAAVEVLHVLLAEDNPDDVALTWACLRKARQVAFAMEAADTFEATLQRLETGNFDVLLLDLSVLDGRDLRESVEAFLQASNIAIVVLTGLDDERYGMEAVSAGAEDYLVKGLSRDLLVHSIRYAAERHRRKEAHLEKQIMRIQALRNIDMAITASLDLRVTLDILLDQVTTQLRVDSAAILRLNPYTHCLEYTAGRGFRTAAIQHTQLRLGESYAGRAALERRVLNIPNIAQTRGDFLRGSLLTSEGFVSYWVAPLITKGRVEGVLELFHRAPLRGDPDWLNFLETMAGQAAIAIENAGLFDNLQRSNVDLQLAYDTTLTGWSKALDLRDKETEGHTLRVTEGTMRLARTMNIKDEELVQIRRGALLHDIGKMGIPDAILLKPGPLTDAEWNIMRKHPDYAYELLAPIAFLRPALDIPYCHHEKWDGSGYPRGLKGEQIPLSARIFAVVDVWDALRSDRPYRAGWPAAKVRDHIAAGSGTHFDPHVVKAFLDTEL